MALCIFLHMIEYANAFLCEACWDFYGDYIDFIENWEEYIFIALCCWTWYFYIF